MGFIKIEIGFTITSLETNSSHRSRQEILRFKHSLQGTLWAL